MSLAMPRFRHDCDRCQSLGQYGPHDLYVCPGGVLGQTLLARYGDDGPEYASLDREIVEQHEARLRARPEVTGTYALIVALDRVRELSAQVSTES